MKKPFLLIPLLLIAGCASPPLGSEGAASTPTTTQARPALEVSEKATCETLIGEDGGLIVEASEFLIEVTGLDDTVAAEAEGIADALEGVSHSASARLLDLLVVMQEPFRDLAAANEKSDTFQLDPARYKAAGNEVISICEPLINNPEVQSGSPSHPSLTVSVDTTCYLLMGANEDGPLLESVIYITQLMSANKQDLTSADVETSKRLSLAINEILETADASLLPYIEEVVKPLDMLAAEDSTGIKVDNSAYKPASIELINLCS